MMEERTFTAQPDEDEVRGLVVQIADLLIDRRDELLPLNSVLARIVALARSTGGAIAGLLSSPVTNTADGTDGFVGNRAEVAKKLIGEAQREIESVVWAQLGTEDRH